MARFMLYIVVIVISRRQSRNRSFMPGAREGAIVNSLVKPVDELQPRYDAIVIGSGYGGGVAASRLARTGLKVCLLEKGRQWRPGDFSNTLKGMWDRTRMTGRYLSLGPENALFDLRTGKQMHILTGCGLGGGSLINAGVAFRPDAKVFEQPDWPEEMVRDGLLEEGFAEAEKMLDVADCPGAENLLSFKSLQACAKGLRRDPGYENVTAEPVSSTITWRPGVNRARVMQSACTRCGDCWTGCNTGAKNTVAVTYLADAKAKGASIFTGLCVDWLEKTDRGWRVSYRQLDEYGGKTIGRGHVEADMVILSAGVPGTIEILLRSRQKGLALSGWLGRGFSANGDDLVMGHDMPHEVNGVAVGHPARHHPETPVGPNCVGMISLSEGPFEDSPVRLQGGTMMLLMAMLAPFKSLMRGKLLRALKMVFKAVSKGPLGRTQCFYIVGHDDARGELRFERDRVVLDWPDVQQQPVFNRARDVLKELFDRTGAEFMQNPVRDWLLGGKLITAHPLGGCRFGKDADSGVVDDRHRVFDPAADRHGGVHEGLYVVDGSVIPTSLGANPLLTITALSERAMQLLAKERGLTIDSAPLGDDVPIRDVFM